MAARILSALESPAREVSVSIVGDRSMRILNRQYLGKDRPTNVLSFSMAEGEFGTLHPEHLGDVVVSADTAAREADEAGISYEERLAALVLHGLLHLSGYDHERSGPVEAERMIQKEAELYSMLLEAGLV